MYYTYPLRPPVKNILTTKTCKQAMPTMTAPSSKLKLNTLFSVLLTVAEVPVFTCAEVFLLASEGGDLAGHAEDGLLDTAELLGSCAGFLGEVCARLVFDLRLWVVRYGAF